MRNNITLSIFLITSVINLVHCVPMPNSSTGNSGYNLEILSKNGSSNSTPTGSWASKIDLSSFYDTFVKNVVPALLEKHEKGATPGKETTHRLGKSITETLTQSLSDAFNSKLGQELMIATGLKKRPTLMQTLYETIAEYFRWMGTIAANKIHEVKEKGLFRTVSDTVSGIFGSHSNHITTTSSPQGQQFHTSTTINTKIPQHGAESSLKTRDLGDRIRDAFRPSDHHHPSYGHQNHQRSFLPWNRFLYQPYDEYNPYSTMPPFMGGGPIAYVGYLICSIFYAIQEFFYHFVGGPPPPPPSNRPYVLPPARERMGYPPPGVGRPSLFGGPRRY